MLIGFYLMANDPAAQQSRAAKTERCATWDSQTVLTAAVPQE
jgi:hypothetical protein